MNTILISCACILHNCIFPQIFETLAVDVGVGDRWCINQSSNTYIPNKPLGYLSETIISFSVVSSNQLSGFTDKIHIPRCVTFSKSHLHILNLIYIMT